MTKRKWKKQGIAIIILTALGLFLIFLCFVYMFLSRPFDKNSEAVVEVTIENGMSTNNIAKELKRRNLIRSELVFKLAVKINTKKTLKAAVYQLQKNMSLDEIVDVLTEGSTYNPDAIRITFLEGETVKKYAIKISEVTNNTYDDVINKLSDKEYLQELIDKYWFLTDEVLNENIYIALEGYLTPNTYEFKNKDVSVEEIIEVMLEQTGYTLKKYKNELENSDMSIHQYLTIASMLELEGTNSDNRKMIAGVFYNRLKNNMNLGSDVTTYYAFQEEMTKDLTSKQFNTSNPYNTRASDMAGKLPVGPICNPSISSIDSSINYEENEYLYFVADKNGKIYYTKTQEEHLNKVDEIKKAGDWIW